jgi:hypothetical protein
MEARERQQVWCMKHIESYSRSQSIVIRGLVWTNVLFKAPEILIRRPFSRAGLASYNSSCLWIHNLVYTRDSVRLTQPFILDVKLNRGMH